MNTERPDNDDAPAESGAAGSAEERDAVTETGTAGTEAPDAAEASGAEQEDRAGASPAGGADADAPGREAEGEAGAAPAAEADADADESGAEASPDVNAGEAAADTSSTKEPGTASDATASADASGAKEPGAGPETEVRHAQQPGAEVRSPEWGPAPGSAEEPGRPHRRRAPLVAASVAAAVLLVGGGGAYLAASASGGSDGGTSSGAPGGDTPPPLALDGYSAPSEGGTNGIAPGEPNPYGATYKASAPLPDGPGSAPVYRATGQVTKAEVARLAKALAVDGTPVAQGQTWTVGATKDGAGPTLQVNRQAPGNWTFHRYVPGTDNCKGTTVCPQTPADPSGEPVSEDAAKKAAAPVLKAVGQDDAKRDASQVMGAQRIVNVDPEVGGLPTYGWTTGVIVGAEGEVVGGSGQLKAPVKGDTYPVLDAEKTLELMNAAPAADPRMGIGGCASPVPLKDRLEEPCGSSSGSAAGKQETVTVENAVFGLASHFVDARQTLVPSWLFEVRAEGAKDSYTVTYPAIDPKYLTSSTPSTEPAQPSPRPSGPGDQPTSAPATRDVEVDGYTAEGTELTVAFTGGVCADYEAKASESEDEVTVTVTETPWPDKVCILIAKEYHRTVRLDEPLGDRKVVGSDGKAVPLEKPGARLPAPSGAR
ncbi:hypothetical protein [Streptomyces sp. S.PNR 29]|uniref:hypothetical protein n=1 Tax=Streptomyces sp. S.PNR 29 TaxID=2973805 RepID=UPI0025AFA37C|nr:hypothetical protein [Streptomyces sp. S.PNR 29]MDN0194699.1 hypothetical protein [Streptomyces sp. S.PNR 29]